MCMKHQWYSICGDGFVENGFGATLFCKKMGFGFGVIKKAERSWGRHYNVVNVGKCHYSDFVLTRCKGGGNTYKITQAEECGIFEYNIECLQGSSY